MTTEKTIGEKIAEDFSTNKVHLTDAEQRRLAGMIDKEFAHRVAVAGRSSEYIATSEKAYDDLLQTLVECRAKWDFQLQRADSSESAMACAMDLANAWAREQGVEQASGLGGDFQLRNLIDRLWSKESIARHAALDKIESQRIELERLRAHLLSGITPND